MGGLFPRIRVTAVSMIAATLAIAGIWPFVGYYSKDEILWRTFQVQGNIGPIPAHFLFWAIGVITALFTAFYMFRLVMKTFFGPPRTDAAKNAQESPWTMIVPIAILGVLAFIAGWPILPLGFEKFQDYLGSTVATPGYAPAIQNAGLETPLGIGTLIAIILVIAYCYMRYTASFKTKHSGELMTPEARANRSILSPGWLSWVLLNKYFVDEAYNFWFVKLGKRLSNWLWLTFDVGMVDGVVNGVGRLAQWSGGLLRRGQTGYVRSYAFSMVVGIILVLIGCLVGFGTVR